MHYPPRTREVYAAKEEGRAAEPRPRVGADLDRALEEIANGYAELVNPLDVEKMAQSIVRCVRDREYRDDLAERGRARSEEFVWRHAAEQTLAIYQRVLEGGIPSKDRKASA